MTISPETIKSQLRYTIDSFDFPFEQGIVPFELTSSPKISGKVRDCYVFGDKRVIIASDRLSAFDVVLTTIPFKGQLLTELAAYWFRETEHIVPNHVIAQPHPNVLICQEAEVLPVEVIVRGYLTGSAWRDYQAGRDISGIRLEPGLKKFCRLPEPLITPSTKAEKGKHDEPISPKEIVETGLVAPGIWEQVASYALQLFAHGTAVAAKRGLILVDTKYEFALRKTKEGHKEVILADEVHTADSSRYWLTHSYEERFAQGEDPDMLDKEFVRRELIAQGFMGEGTPPILSDDFRVETALKYMELFKQLTGQDFSPNLGDPRQEIITAIKAYFSQP